METAQTLRSALHSHPPVSQTHVHVQRSPWYTFNGTASYLHALRKFQFQPPKKGKVFVNKFSRLAVRDENENEIGEVQTSDIQNDTLYLCPVKIGEGENAVTLKLDFDTGSADLWGTFDINSPTSKVLSGSTWAVHYGDGSTASGNVYTDTVTLGGLVIKNQAVECATQLSSAFYSGAGDGLLGLSFGALNSVKPTPVLTPVQNMDTEGVIPKGTELFTCKLTRHNEAPGFYTFGYIDKEQFGSSQIFYTPLVDNTGYWKVSSVSATVNGKVISRPNNTAACDTGTSLCLVDSTLCKAIYSQIPGSKYDADSEGWIFPNSVAESDLPAVEIALGSANEEMRFSIHPGDLVFSDATTGYIYGGIQERGDVGFDVLGDMFLKNIYAIWDVKNRRFGAVQRQPGPVKG